MHTLMQKQKQSRQFKVSGSFQNNQSFPGQKQVLRSIIRPRHKPGNPAAKPLLPARHQAALPAVIQRSCADNFAGTDAATCRGRIDVRAGEISLPNVSFFHLYIVFTDADGDSWAMRGGPSGGGAGYGNITTECSAYNRTFVDYDPRSPSVAVYEGDDACAKARAMKAHLEAIQGWNIPYAPDGPNSNSVVASLLLSAGLPLRKPNVAAPGFDTRLSAEGAVGTGGLGDRRHRLFLQFNNSEQFSALGLGYSIDAADYYGISFPIILGAEFTFNNQMLLGMLGAGLELPLLNIPSTPLAPTHLRLSGGLLAGAQPGADPLTRNMDALVGGYFQAQLGMDIGQFRISPFYRYSGIHNLTTGTSISTHAGGILIGFTL